MGAEVLWTFEGDAPAAGPSAGSLSPNIGFAIPGAAGLLGATSLLRFVGLAD